MRQQPCGRVVLLASLLPSGRRCIFTERRMKLGPCVSIAQPSDRSSRAHLALICEYTRSERESDAEGRHKGASRTLPLTVPLLSARLYPRLCTTALAAAGSDSPGYAARRLWSRESKVNTMGAGLLWPNACGCFRRSDIVRSPRTARSGRSIRRDCHDNGASSQARTTDRSTLCRSGAFTCG